MRLTTTDHDRDQAGLTYVYAVVSRRARGVSIGVNLNPNDACNWRCVYCQVPGLVFGNAPELDLPKLEHELGTLLDLASEPEWMERHVPEDSRRLKDVALSGNGEPTSSRQLPEVLAAIERVLRARGLLGRLPVVLITNGSLIHLPHVRSALAALAALGGELWFKLDSATAEGQQRLNSNRAGLERLRENLALAAQLCPTWIQTLALDFDGPTLAGEEERAYCDFLNERLRSGVALRGVLLYGLARESHQPEAPRLRPLAPRDLEALGERIARSTGIEVRVSP